MTSSRRRATSRRWLRIGLNIGIPAVVAVVVGVWASGSDLLGWPKPVVFWLTVVLLIAAAVIQVWRGVVDDRDIATTDDEVNDLRIAMKDSLLPPASLLAELPGMTKGKREEHVKRVAHKATEVLAFLLLKHVNDIRANLFVLNQRNDRLAPLVWSGHGDEPHPFVAGTAKGDDALQRVKIGEPLFCEDIREDPPAGGARADAPYVAFISVPVRGGGFSYGMLTVDAPKRSAFTDTDLQTVRVVAEMLAVGFATTFPGKNAGTAA